MEGRNPGQDTKKKLGSREKMVPSTIRIVGTWDFFSPLESTQSALLRCMTFFFSLRLLNLLDLSSSLQTLSCDSLSEATI